MSRPRPCPVDRCPLRRGHRGEHLRLYGEVVREPMIRECWIGAPRKKAS